MNFIERKYFGAKLERVNRVLHGAGQDRDRFRRYAALFPPDQQPAVYVTYIGITGDAARIGYEFEGNWNSYRPETYREAFVHITEMMRQRQLNVATVWCSAGA